RPPIWTPMHVGASKISRSRIEAQQHTGAAYIEIAYLIDLVCDGNRFAQEGHQRIVTVRHLDEYGLMPGMLVEIPANNLLIFWPLVERVGRRMHAEKTAARPDEIRESQLLGITHG